MDYYFFFYTLKEIRDRESPSSTDTDIHRAAITRDEGIVYSKYGLAHIKHEDQALGAQSS